MLADTRPQLISQLETTHNELVALLQSVSDSQDWQPAPDAWSFRYHAAHLAVTDQEAFWPRVTTIAAGENPHFDYYLNTDRDFSRWKLLDSLAEWTATRRQILDFVAGLPESKLSLTGTHATFGVITVLDTLQTMLDHDREHLAELRQMVAVFGSEYD